MRKRIAEDIGTTDRSVRRYLKELEQARALAVGYDLLHDPIQILLVWRGGLVMYGGFFGAMLLGTWASRRKGLNPWNALDTGLICGFFGQAVGRWGCLLVGDDHGSVVPEQYESLPFPLTIQVPSLEWLQANPDSLFDHQLADQVLWATQPWMSINAALVALVGWWFLRRRRWMGQVAAVVLIQYTITRFIIESFRGDSVRGLWFNDTISTSQLIAIPGLLVGIYMYMRRVGGGPPPKPAGELAAETG